MLRRLIELRRKVKSGIVPSPWTREFLDFLKVYQIRKQRVKNIKVFESTVDISLVFLDKLIFNGFFRGLGFPVATDLAVMRDGRLLSTDFREGTITMGDLSGRSLFAKSRAGGGGRNTLAFDVDKDGQVGPENYRQLLAIGETQDTLIQERITQHIELNELYSCAVNTIRIISISSVSGIVAPWAILRVGSHGSVVDNWAAGGLVVSIDMRTGMTVGPGVIKSGLLRLEEHPDSGKSLNQIPLPYFQEALHMVLAMHAAVPYVPSVGWDIAITENGPLVIEGNHDWEANFHRLFSKSFDRDFMAILAG